MGFHQPPSTILFDDPYTQRHPLISPRYTSIRCVKDAEMITWQKHLAQLIGQKMLF